MSLGMSVEAFNSPQLIFHNLTLSPKGSPIISRLLRLLQKHRVGKVKIFIRFDNQRFNLHAISCAH
jgi:hypothetical protein